MDGLNVQIYDTLDVLEVLRPNVLIDITETRHINPSTSKSKEGNQRSEGKINLNVHIIANSKLSDTQRNNDRRENFWHAERKKHESSDIRMFKKNISKSKGKGELSIKVWNIFGLKQSKISKIRNKTDKYLNNILDTSDIVIFTETWSEKGDSDFLTGMMTLKKL